MDAGRNVLLKSFLGLEGGVAGANIGAVNIAEELAKLNLRQGDLLTGLMLAQCAGWDDTGGIPAGARVGA